MLSRDGRHHEAFDILGDTEGAGDADWDATYVACLLALGRVADAQNHRWAGFCETLDVQTLRDYLKVLPDFEDIEHEDSAKAHALRFPDMATALEFFLEWPDLAHAARLVEDRAAELDGNMYHLLTPAADALCSRYPLAATLLWRAMIEYTLWEGRSSRYAHAADHLMDCAAAEAEITDYSRFIPHPDYVEQLRVTHKHKASFWARVP
jgi:TPR repeat protein